MKEEHAMGPEDFRDGGKYQECEWYHIKGKEGFKNINDIYFSMISKATEKDGTRSGSYR